MSESDEPKAGGESDGSGDKPVDPGSGAPNSGQGDDSGQISQQLQHTPVSARVPEKVARGVFSTGVIVIDGPFEFVLDFVMNLTQPRGVVARVVLAPQIVEQFLVALKDNIGKYEGRFGPIPPLPRPQMPPKPPTIQEIYDDLKISDETQAGAYANAVMIGHGASEFTFDFITRFFPNAAVASRVYMAAPQAPRMMESLTTSLKRWKQRYGQGGGGQQG